MCNLESPEGSPGSGTGGLDPDFLGVGWGLSTPAPWKRSYHSTGTKDAGMGTIGTCRLKRTGASGIQKTHRMASGNGMVASTPGSKILNWTHEKQVSLLGRTGHGYRHLRSRGRPSRTWDGFQRHPREPVYRGQLARWVGPLGWPVGLAKSGMEGNADVAPARTIHKHSGA